MSHTRSFIDPLDVAGHLKLEPEVKRATLLSWASDRAAVAEGRLCAPQAPRGCGDASEGIYGTRW